MQKIFNKWPRRDLFRELLINDYIQAMHHAEYFRAKSDWARCRNKTEQVNGFAGLIERFDAWKPKPKEKKGIIVDTH